MEQSYFAETAKDKARVRRLVRQGKAKIEDRVPGNYVNAKGRLVVREIWIVFEQIEEQNDEG